MPLGGGPYVGVVSAVLGVEEEDVLDDEEEAASLLLPPSAFSNTPPATVALLFFLHHWNWSVSCSKPRKVPFKEYAANVKFKDSYVPNHCVWSKDMVILNLFEVAPTPNSPTTKYGTVCFQSVKPVTVGRLDN